MKYSHQCPPSHPQTSIVEEFEVEPVSDPGIQLNPHIVVVDDGPAELEIVDMCWREMCLEVHDGGQKVPVNIEGNHQGLPILRNDSRIHYPDIHDDGIRDMGDNPGQQSIDTVR